MELIRGNRLPEERLFQAVLLQAFEDALNMGQHKQDAYAKQDSYDWFTNDTELFNDICWSGYQIRQLSILKFN